MPFVLWTREAVQHLLAERFDLKVSVWTVGRYLASWGLTPQKPLRRAYERDPAAVKRWLKEEFPAIRAAAKREKAEIHWGDQMGLRSDHQTGTSYGRRGKTSVIPATGQRFGCNMMSTLTNRGVLTFMVFKRRFTASVCIQFLRRLLRQRKRTVFLILDRHPVHRSAAVQRWIEQHAHRLRLFFLRIMWDGYRYSADHRHPKYDLAGHGLTTTDANTHTTTVTYDGNYRRASVTNPIGAVVAYTCDEHGDGSESE